MSSAEKAAAEAGTTPWHAMPPNEVEKQFRVDPRRGLDSAEAVERLKTYGLNRLPQGKKKGPLMRFLAQFNSILIYVLLAAGFIKLMLSLWLDASIIFAVVILNAILSFFCRRDAPRRRSTPSATCCRRRRVLRGGEVRLIPAEDVIPGDVVLLESGDKVPADMRLVDARNLRTEEAALTGESVPAEKTTDPVSAKATVQEIRIRDHGRYSDHLGTAFLLGSLARAHVLRRAVPGGRRHRGVADPGRPAGAHHHHPRHWQERMAQRSAIIRRLPAVETLGSVSRICSDKTGNLRRDCRRLL
jgi:magnesium-transporting ATPase (P-type)